MRYPCHSERVICHSERSEESPFAKRKGVRGMPSPFCVSKPLSLPLSEGELKGVPAKRDAGGSYTYPRFRLPPE